MRIVHLGVGNFHRAHQAAYTDEANRLAGTHWRITGVSLRRPDVRDALAPEGFAYTLEIDDGSGPAYRRIGVIDRILVAPEDRQAVIDAIADPETAIVSLTVTEKGYCLRPSDRRLDRDHPAIRDDLAGGPPTSAVGILAAGIAARRARGAGGLTVVCCDNLPDNGAVLRAAVADFAGIRDPGLADYVATAVAFPSTMVDRITPATTDELRARVRATTGFADAWPVAAEGFGQWVIEDRFAGPRPAWERAGAEFVADVRPYELRKLRMLNGAHSTLAYAGLNAGLAFVHEAVADPRLLALARAVMAEAAETLPEDVRATAPGYADDLVRRFANPGVRHRLIQIAMDGSQKLPVRLLGTLRARLGAGSDSPAIETAVAAWIGFVRRQTQAGVALDDPFAATLAAMARGGDAAASARAMLGEPRIFGTLGAEHPAVVDRIVAAVG